MKVTRKFNLGRIGHQYESVEIEAEGPNIEHIIAEIDRAWKAYSKSIKEGIVE
jgi:IS1 family transposase